MVSNSSDTSTTSEAETSEKQKSTTTTTENTSDGSESSHNDDPENDPDYEPSNDDDDDDDDNTDDDCDCDEDEDDKEDDMIDKQNLLRTLAPLLGGLGGIGRGKGGNGIGLQLPMMFVIQTNNKNTPNSDEEDEQDEEDELLDRELEKVEKEMIEKEEKKRQSKRKRSKSNNDISKIIDEYNKEEKSYIEKLPEEEKKRVLDTELRIKKLQQDTSSLPMRFKILESPMDDGTKRIILAKLEQFQRMYEGASEYYKLRNWLNSVNRLPLGRFKSLPIMGDPNKQEDIEKVSEYLFNVKKTLDDTVFGHREAKEQILRILSQWISNPSTCGHCIGIQGAAGCGKTSLVKDGICKALSLPFSLISLGCYGSDGSALTGHHVTYEGSTYGKISESLMKAGYMNPILYFDELDKISQTPKGEEVASVLIHLTDSTQNDHFSDNYFSEIPLDLSKCLIIFSYNDESLVNPILKDRMITIRVAGYTKKEKVEIAQNYLIPRILKTYNLNQDDIVFDQSIIEEIIERVPPEEGVRNMKRGIEAIISWINMRRYIPNIIPAFSEKQRDTEKEKDKEESSVKIELPVKITSNLVKKYLKNTDNISKHVMASMYL